MKRIKPILIILLLILVFRVSAQEDYSWWVNVHHWDGHTPWLSYLTYSPQYFGPNALPVPEVQKGKIDTAGFVEAAIDSYFGHGDKTQDLFTRLYYPIVPGIVAFEGYVVPIEHFAYDTLTRDIRASRLKSGEGTAGGDIYFSTLVQLVKNRKFPDMALRMAFRTASGTNVSAARYTDAPGYFFDLSIGKNFHKSKAFIKNIRPYLMLGFYSWQTNSAIWRQDDAPMYGAGLDISLKKISFSFSSAGYYGYINNHDKPLVSRISMEREFKHYKLGLFLQAGIFDYPYNSVRFSFKYILPEKLLLYKKD